MQVITSKLNHCINIYQRKITVKLTLYPKCNYQGLQNVHILNSQITVQ